MNYEELKKLMEHTKALLEKRAQMASTTSDPTPRNQPPTEQEVREQLGLVGRDDIKVKVVAAPHGDIKTAMERFFADNAASHATPTAQPDETWTATPATTDDEDEDEDDDKFTKIIGDVIDEVFAASDKHGPMNSPHEGHSVIREEFEELWEHVKNDTGDTLQARKEAVQLAAMAIRYIYDLID